MEGNVFGLTCNHLDTPLGIDSLPAFSWKYSLPRDRGSQVAYRIGVASTPEMLDNGNFDCWDTGVVDSGLSQSIEYAGNPLASRTGYHWLVTVYDIDGHTVTGHGQFETGKLTESWQAQWIAAAHQQRADDAQDAPLLRKCFELKDTPQRARLYICSPGYFDAFINGQPTSDELLTTPFTRYDSTLLYCTYDVTDQVQSGSNAIGVTIGNGWYNCFTADIWNSREATWRHVPKLVAELHVAYADGTQQIIATDGTWKSTRGPITFNGIRNGEHYDARLERSGWDEPGLDESDWDAAKVIRSPGGLLSAMEMEPIRVTDTITPVAQWETPEKGYVFDTGQNMAGIARITVSGSAGDEIVIRYGERLQEDGVHINLTANAGFIKSGEFQTDRYFKKGDDLETWQPRFVYHGFQFIEVSGCSQAPVVAALVVHTDVADTGDLSCENETITRLQHATRWATRTNLHGLPTDDPHREKNAWTGDVALSAEQMLCNFHAAPLLRKWLADIRDAQRPDGALPCVVPSTGWGYNWGNGPDWSSALTLIPWNIYVYTGDNRILRENYDAVVKHFAYMESMAEDFIVNYGIGDWCPPFEGPAIAVSMSSFKSPTALTDTAYFYNAAVILGKMAAVLGKPDDERHYQASAARIKQAFRDQFYDHASQSITGDCQTSTACMIYQGLAEKDEQQPLLDLLLQQIEATGHHQDTGILGNKYLYNVLGEAGRMDVGLKMVLNETYPSFRNWMDRGATTLWECWNGEGSQNHHMFSDISAALLKYVGGIKPDENEPGFRHIIMKPAIDCGLTSVRCHHESPFGPIRSQWEIDNEAVQIDIEIPHGSRASYELPQAYDAVDYPRELLPGQHRFAVPAKEA